MSVRILIILFFLSLCGLFLGTYGDQEGTNGAPIASRHERSAPLIKIPEPVLNMFTGIFKSTVGRIYPYVKEYIEGLRSIVFDFLGFLASSDDTRLARQHGSTSTRLKRFAPFKAAQAGIFSLFSRVFMLPFQAAMASVRLIPFGPMLNGATTIINGFLSNPVVQKAAEQLILAGEQTAMELWKFAKVNVFPPLDKWVTGLKNTNALPDMLMMPLIELQTLYHILHMFNIA